MKEYSKKVNILGFEIDNLTRDEVMEIIETYASSGKCHSIVTANPIILLKARKDSEYEQVLNNASLILPDGIGLVWASMVLKRPLKGRVPGITILLSMINYITTYGKTVFFLGGRPKVNKKLIKNVLRNFPALRVVGSHHGYFNKEREADIIMAIRKAAPDFLFVGLGAPKQEKWIFYNQEKLKSRIAMGVGGSFDVISGTVSRSPEWMQNSGLEWLFRIIVNPWKFFNIFRILKFIILIFHQRFRENQAKDKEFR